MYKKRSNMLLSLALSTVSLFFWQSIGEAAPQDIAEAVQQQSRNTPQTEQTPLVVAEQGSFTVGGATKQHEGNFSVQHFLEPTGQTAYGDHAYVYYQKPLQPRDLPLIFEHGGAQTKRTWESTVDGREGFQNIFLRKGYSTYLVDQPRIGEAGLALQADDGSNPYAANPMYADHTMFMLCRIGTYDQSGKLKPYDNVAFPHDTASLDQFQRTWTPYTGKLDDGVSADALAALLKKTGPGVLVTHSMGGTVGWRTVFRTDNVKGIVAFEPGGSPFLFPEGEKPAQIVASYAPVSATAMEVPLQDFEKLTKIPIILFYGDNIAKEASDDVGPDKWRTEMAMAQKFVEAINRHGGQAELVHLPDIGIYGNTHFLMGDTNNKQIAELMEQWLEKHGLAERTQVR